MAGKSTISITFKLDGDGKGFKDISQNADGLKQAMTAAILTIRLSNNSSVILIAVGRLSPVRRAISALLIAPLSQIVFSTSLRFIKAKVNLSTRT